jgi:WD40 repeat protein
MIPILNLPALLSTRTQATVSIKPLKTVEGIRPLAFAPGPKASRFVCSLEDKSVRIMDAATHSTIRTFTGHPQPPMAVAWSADGEIIASGDESARVITWNAETGARLQTMQGHQRGIQDLSFNFPRTLLVSTGKDDMVKIWNPATGKSVASIPGNGANFYSATFCGKTSDFGVGILGPGAREYLPNGKVEGFFTEKDGQGVFDIAFNPAGTRAVTAGRDGKAIVWDTKTHEKLGTLYGHADWVVHCAWSPNGKWIATSGDDRTVRIWNPYTFKQVGELDDQQAIGSPICWTADGKYLISVDISDFLEVNSVTPPQAGGATPNETPTKKKHRR